MKLFRAVAIVAVIGLAAAAAVEAQGRGQRPATPRNPQATRPAPTRPATGRPAERPERPAARTNDARGNEGADIAANISRNPQQKARLEAMLPAGMTLEQAASGFRNQGQFIAALQASKNQNIPFDQLKAEMTGESALSLGQAVQKLKPEPAPQPQPQS